MAIHKNIWYPDTCDCVIEYEWDDTQDASIREHKISQVIKQCDEHKIHADKDKLFEEVLKKNREKNRKNG